MLTPNYFFQANSCLFKWLSFPVILALLFLSCLLPVQNVLAGNDATVTIQTDGIIAIASVSGVTSMQVRVAGPGNFYEAVRSETTRVQWYAPEVLMDGEYRYEVFLTVGDEWQEDSETNRLYRYNGRFLVKDNVITPWQESNPVMERPLTGNHSVSQSGWLSQMLQKVLTWMIPAAHAVDTTISDTTPELFFNDTNNGSEDWAIYGDQDEFYIWNYDASSLVLHADDATPFYLRLFTTFYAIRNDIAGGYSLYLDQGAGLDAFRADSAGDIELADGSVFIDKSANHVGIGTVTPQQGLHVADTAPAILLEDTDVNSVDWTLNNNADSFWFDIHWDTGAQNASPFKLRWGGAENSFLMDGVGNIGIGTGSPSAPLHVVRTDGTAQLKVEEVSGTTTKRQLFRLINNGILRLHQEKDTSIAELNERITRLQQMNEKHVIELQTQLRQMQSAFSALVNQQQSTVSLR